MADYYAVVVRFRSGIETEMLLLNQDVGDAHWFLDEKYPQAIVRNLRGTAWATLRDARRDLASAVRKTKGFYWDGKLYRR